MFSPLLFLRSNPFIRLLTALIVGILIQNYFVLSLQTWLIIFSAIVLLSFIFIQSSFGVRFKFFWMQGLLLLVAVVCIGAICFSYSDVSKRKDWIGNYQGAKKLLIELKESPIEKTNSFKAEASVVQAYQGKWLPTHGKIIIYFSKKIRIEFLNENDRLVIPSKLQPIKNSGNPGAFDYATYCRRRGIFHQIFLSEKNSFQILKRRPGVLSLIRKYVIQTLQKNIPDKNAASIAAALLIGYKADIDKDIIQAYSNTGVIHIIAISGLHLALIYGLLLKIFDLIPGLRRTKAKWLLVLAMLWLFSILTGASPSVLRAAVMFSFILLGKCFGKEPKPLNNLAASAFLLLLYDPNFLFDAGFQLSYAAVASIMIYYKHIYNLLYIKNKLLDNLWKLNAVTISAQILTLPFVLYHFHQFPNLFLFTNLVAVPLSGIILYAEIILLAVSPINIIAKYIGACVGILIEKMNSYITYMNAFRFSVSENILLNSLGAILLCTFILLLSYSLLSRKRNAVFYALTALLILCFMNLKRNFSVKKHPKLVVYNINQHSGIELFNGSQSFFTGDKELLTNATLYNFNIRPAHTLFSINEPTIYFKYRSFSFGKRKITIGKKCPTMSTDVFIISGNPNLNEMQLHSSPTIVVADNTNARWKITRWKKQADSLHLRFHSVPDDGAFIMDL